MKLPNGEHAVVDLAKMREYCLNPLHSRGRHKAKVFASFDIFQDDSEMLRESLLFAAREAEALPGEVNGYGQRYTLDFQLTHQGRSLTVRSHWMVRNEENFPRLTTCFVL